MQGKGSASAGDGAQRGMQGGSGLRFQLLATGTRRSCPWGRSRRGSSWVLGVAPPPWGPRGLSPAPQSRAGQHQGSKGAARDPLCPLERGRGRAAPRFPALQAPFWEGAPGNSTNPKARTRPSCPGTAAQRFSKPPQPPNPKASRQPRQSGENPKADIRAWQHWGGGARTLSEGRVEALWRGARAASGDRERGYLSTRQRGEEGKRMGSPRHAAAAGKEAQQLSSPAHRREMARCWAPGCHRAFLSAPGGCGSPTPSTFSPCDSKHQVWAGSSSHLGGFAAIPNIWLSGLAFGSGAPDGPRGQADATRPAPWWDPRGLFAKPVPAPCSIKGCPWLQRAREPLPTLLLLRLSRTGSSAPYSEPSTTPGCEPGGITLEQAQAQGCKQIPVEAVQIPPGVLQRFPTRARLAGFGCWAPSPGLGRAGEEQKQSWPRGD